MIEKELTTGVSARIIETTKFKTVAIAVDFMTESLDSNMTKRSLLSYLMTVSSQAYHNQQAVAQQLIELYGATYFVDVVKIGQSHHVRFGLQIPAPQYIGESDQFLVDALNFLKTMIFHPLVDDDHFDQRAFDKEKHSLFNDLRSVFDNKKRYAGAKLNEMTYNSVTMSQSAKGRLEKLDEITSKALYHTYQEMISQDRVSIAVVGDVTGTQIIDELASWAWTAREKVTIPVYYRQGIRPTTYEKTEKQPELKQTSLQLSYHLNIAPHSDERFVAMIFNGLFGGTPQSKLFANVREKQSLVYTVFSKYLYDTGFLIVAAGLNAKNVNQADQIIQEQLSKIASGDFDQSELTTIVSGYINDYLSSEDSLSQQIERILLQMITEQQTSKDDWLAGVQQVTKADVMTLAKKVALQNRFILEPETKD